MAEGTSKQTGGATDSQANLPGRMKVKEEYDSSFMGQHKHRFYIKFGDSKTRHRVDCKEPQTVLEAIRSRDEYKKLEWSEDKIVIQWGTENRKNIIATHFPCTCLQDKDTLIVSQASDTVEERRTVGPILPKDEYSVFYIDTVGGTNAKKKKLFKSNKVKEFKSLCVYGEKDITVQEALERDGRFAELPGFTLIDNNKQDDDIQSDNTVDDLNGEELQIKLPRGKQPGNPQTPKDSDASGTKQAGKAESASARKRQKRCDSPGPSGDAHQTVDTSKLESLVKRSGFRVEDVDLQEIMKKLREQFPALKKQMEDRFPGNEFQEALNLKKENFGKIRQDFSEVRTLEELLEKGNSVCKVVVEGFHCCNGTGFVLVHNFIMTNAHLFKGCTEGITARKGTNVYVHFYNKNLPRESYYKFKVENSYICFIEGELDYAVLKVSTEGETWGPPSEQPKKPTLPPGLLEYFGEMPENGGACIIGHPDGGVKQIDLTCVIEPKERRGQAAEYNLKSYRQSSLIFYILVDNLKRQGIDRIMMGGDRAEEVMTYNTFMYHGSSGSPVFDAQGRVCALHTAGYIYEFRNITDSVIEFGQSLQIIMTHLVEKLTIGKDQELLGRIREVSEKNPYIKEIFESVCGRECDDAQESGSDESMETN